MKKHQPLPHIVQTISEWHQLYNLPKPHHPLISVVDVSLLSYEHSDVWKNFSRDFYCISIKEGHNCKLRYGQRDYDFDGGAMIFSKPGQVMQITETDRSTVSGYVLTFKADLIRN
jgi:AraC family transcriptional activator of pobA